MYQVLKPKSPLLSQHIESFNLLNNSEQFKAISYYAFPQKGITMAFLKNTEIEIFDHHFKLKRNSKNKFTVLLLGKYLKPLHLQYDEFVDEIAINFSPTGFNYFFEKNIDEMAPFMIQTIEEASWKNLSKQLFKMTEFNKQIDHLEDFLLNSFKKKNIKTTESAVQMIEKDSRIKISEIANLLDISDRTLNRYFNQYVGCSAINFRKICRFRNAVKNNLESERIYNLTEICYNNNFYDSPHFNKEFKNLTHTNPKKFFKKVNQVGDDGYPYIFT